MTHRWVILAFLMVPEFGRAQPLEIHQIPDEYETTSGHGVAMNNGGYAANDSFSAIRANPALLAGKKEYSMNAGYHWPVLGRDYYQAGIVDSKTSSVAAGVSYTGYTDDYAYANEDSGASRYDSPLIRRGVIGLAQNFGALSLGAGATYVEAHSLLGSQEQQRGETRVKGAGFNVGVAGALGPGLLAGASVENATNRKIADYAPRTYRAGLAYQFAPTLSGFLDMRQRDRVPLFEADEVDIDDEAKESDLINNPERMIIGSLVAQVQDFLRLIGSYGQSTTDDRRSLAGGVAIINKNFSLSYTAAQPYMKRSTAHQAVTLSFEMAM